MQLHQLAKTSRKRQRVGRGGKRGTTSGRGQKGQKSRSGRRIRPAERDLILRLPKRRGFRNKIKSAKPIIFNLGDLAAKIKKLGAANAPMVLDKKFLKEAGFVPKNYSGEVKILGDGNIDFAAKVNGIAVSKSAKEKIEKAGGKVE